MNISIACLPEWKEVGEMGVNRKTSSKNITCLNGSLSSSYRHIGCVGYQSWSLVTDLAFIFSTNAFVLIDEGGQQKKNFQQEYYLYKWKLP